MHVRVFAHRGASTAFAENTRAAFAHALAVGSDGIETDVQLSADGYLVCWHDATLDRTSTGQGPVGAYSLEALQQLDVHSWKTPTRLDSTSLPAEYGTPENQLVTLDQLTRLIIAADRAVELAVEMKVDSAGDRAVEGAVLDWLQRWEWDPVTGRLKPNGVLSTMSVSVMSFSHVALGRVASAAPALTVCALFKSNDRRTSWATLLGPSVRWLAKPRWVRSQLRAGHTLRMWTVETTQQLLAARKLGVQEVTVNDPEWALRQLR